MTINLAPSRRSLLLSHNGSGSWKPGCSAVFLIANTRLEFNSSHRKLSPLKFPNRERMTISNRVAEPPAGAQDQFLLRRTRSVSANQPPCRRFTRLKFLIVTQGLEFPLKRAKTTPSKFLIVTKRAFFTRPAARDSLPSLHSPNFNLSQRDEQRLKRHGHSCLPRGTKGLCSDDLQLTTSNHHPRPHFTSASTQLDPPQSDSRELRSPNFNLNQRNEQRLRWHRHSCLCSDDLQPTTSNHHPRPHFTCTSTQPKPQLQSSFPEQAEAA
jgi:hypothetical protein